jgi:hypothetical protein
MPYHYLHFDQYKFGPASALHLKQVLVAIRGFIEHLHVIKYRRSRYEPCRLSVANEACKRSRAFDEMDLSGLDQAKDLTLGRTGKGSKYLWCRHYRRLAADRAESLTDHFATPQNDRFFFLIGKLGPLLHQKYCLPKVEGLKSVILENNVACPVKYSTQQHDHPLGPQKMSFGISGFFLTFF